MPRGVPANQTRLGWWYHASQEEKFEQIDAAIELNMTSKQCAMNCGVNAETLRGFAAAHNRSFGGSAYVGEKREVASAKMSQIMAKVHRKKRNFAAAKDAFEHGEPVDFWSVE